VNIKKTKGADLPFNKMIQEDFDSMGNSLKNFEFIAEQEKKDMPLYTIGIVSELVGTTNQTLRLYEKHGLIKPTRKNKNRFFSENDVRWLLCLRSLIHKKKISIEGIKKLLEYAPCWEITECPENTRNACSAYVNNTKPCWEYNQSVCKHQPMNACGDCVVHLSKYPKTKKMRRNGNGNGS
jgi:MerR family transcriptional regulator/heat shock protein HspR